MSIKGFTVYEPKRRTRGSDVVQIDGHQLNAAFARRGYTSAYVARKIGINPGYLSVIKRKGRITAELRSLLRDELGIWEEEYVTSSIPIACAPEKQAAQPAECILLRRDELKSIVHDAVLDLLREIGGAVA